MKKLIFLEGLPGVGKTTLLNIMKQKKIKNFYFVDEIINSKKKSEIEDLLDNWQTKDGSKAVRGKKAPETEAEKKLADKVFEEIIDSLIKGKTEFNREKLRIAFDKVYKVGDSAETTLMNIIKDGYLKIRIRRG